PSIPYTTLFRSTLLQMAPAIPYAMQFDSRSIELFGGINRYHSVRRIASGIRRPELDVARDLAQLIKQRFVLPIGQEAITHSNGNERNVRLPDPAERHRMDGSEFM